MSHSCSIVRSKQRRPRISGALAATERAGDRCDLEQAPFGCTSAVSDSSIRHPPLNQSELDSSTAFGPQFRLVDSPCSTPRLDEHAAVAEENVTRFNVRMMRVQRTYGFTSRCFPAVPGFGQGMVLRVVSLGDYRDR